MRLKFLIVRITDDVTKYILDASKDQNEIHCSAFIPLKSKLYNHNFMETANVPKFKWGEISELNSGHTPNEWGTLQKAKPKQTMIIAYDISWNT